MSALPESATMKSGAAAHPRSKLAFSSGVVPRWPVGVMILTVFMRGPPADGEAACQAGVRARRTRASSFRSAEISTRITGTPSFFVRLEDGTDSLADGRARQEDARARRDWHRAAGGCSEVGRTSAAT